MNIVVHVFNQSWKYIDEYYILRVKTDKNKITVHLETY